jgi:hypothetical protein
MNYAIITVDVLPVVPDVEPKARYTEYLVAKPWINWYIVGSRNKYSKTGEWYFSFKGYPMKDVQGEIVETHVLTPEEAFAEFL